MKYATNASTRQCSLAMWTTSSCPAHERNQVATKVLGNLTAYLPITTSTVHAAVAIASSVTHHRERLEGVHEGNVTNALPHKDSPPAGGGPARFRHRNRSDGQFQPTLCTESTQATHRCREGRDARPPRLPGDCCKMLDAALRDCHNAPLACERGGEQRGSSMQDLHDCGAALDSISSALQANAVSHQE